MIVNKPCTRHEYADLADYCTQNGCHIVEYSTHYESAPNVHPVPTLDELKALRRKAYIEEVDPITAHIVRLSAKEQTPEIIAEIEALSIERDEKVAEIQARYPYPEMAEEIVE